MKKTFIAAAVAVFTMVSTHSFAQTSAKGLIISTSSNEEVQKVLASLKDADPSTYRFAVTSSKNGKQTTAVYGTAPIGSMTKVAGSKGALKNGGISASDVIVAVKVITTGKELQNAIISQLNRNLSKQSVKSIALSAQH